MVRILTSAVLAAGLLLSGQSFADDDVRDSSADSQGFAQQLDDSKGVLIRVAVNERGEEFTNGAQMRIHAGATSVTTSGANIINAWNEGVDATNQPVVTDSQGQITDSSTWGWFGWRGYGWRSPYYYYNYRPRAYYYGSYYTYTNTYYYSTYGYRYYYYCW